LNLDCRRWAKLADLEALGEAVPSDGPAFQRAHEAACATCAREAALWRSMRAGEDNAAPNDAEVESLLALVAGAQQRRASTARRSSGAWGIGVAVCAAAAAILWFGGALTKERQSEGDQQAQRPAPGTSLQSRAPTRSGAASERSIDSGREARCSELIPGATVCLERGGVLGRRALSGSQRELEVVRGRVVVSLAPQPPGTSFSLTTTSGKVTAVGTIFSVDVSADGSTVARVVEGKVLALAGSESTALPIHAGQALRLGERQPRELSALEREADMALLSLSGTVQRSASPDSSQAKPAGSGRDPTETLEYARALRARGDLARAAEVYRKIHAASPASPSGRAALVSLGGLLLTLRDPRGALNAFDSYLAGGGPLAQEAMFGRVRALRALNRPAEERLAIERFLAAYPEAPQRHVLRARLSAIQR
jgi:ferric-dicitrate binding protein FerR (iron transport regulator)